MKIHFDNVNFSARTGPNVFANRLARALIELGHDVVEQAPADVSIVFIEPSGAQLSSKVVQRLDGIWFKPQDFIKMNVSIKRMYGIADGVIWQSQFDKAMCTKWWDQPGAGTVIHNGISQPPCDQVSFSELAKIRNDNDLVFVCSSNWHAQKRLRANIELFMQIRKSVPKSCLFVMGNNPDVRVPNDQRIMYAGSQPEDVYTQIYAISDWMLHLAWLDHCPNVVVEALNQNTPVIHSSSGGTSELVKQFGICVKETHTYNYELADYDNPPIIDVTQVDKLPSRNELGEHADVSMKTCADAYVRFLESIV